MASHRISSKLFKLKEWLTVPEAAKYLTTLFGEEVTEADVLRLALDRHLQLSVYFVNHANAICVGKFLPFAEWEQNFKNSCSWETIEPIVREEDNKIDFYFPVLDAFVCPSYLQIEAKKSNYNLTQAELRKEFENTFPPERISYFVSRSVNFFANSTKEKAEKFGGKVPHYIFYTKEIENISGVWDLTMLGAEKLIIENEYQRLTGGPKISTKDKQGIQVTKRWMIYQLQGCANEEMRWNGTDYYPFETLPGESVLVVRTNALIDLQERLKEDHAETEPTNSLKPSEKKSLVKMVFAMAVDCYGYDPNDKKSPVTKDILKAAAQADTSICADTVRKWLDEGAKLRKDDF